MTTHTTPILTALLLLTALQISCACRGEPATPVEVCERLEAMAKENGDPFQGLGRCITGMERVQKENPAIFECTATCAHNAEGYKGFNACTRGCSSEIALSATAEAGTPPGGATIEVSTRPGASVTVSLKGMKKAPEPERAKADEKGHAKVVFEALPRDFWTATVKTSAGDTSRSTKVTFTSGSGMARLEGLKVKGGSAKVKCELELTRPKRERIQARKPFPAATDGEYGRKIRFALEVNGGEKLAVGKRRVLFQDGRAVVSLDLADYVGEIRASDSGASAPTIAIPTRIDTDKGTLEGSLRCAGAAVEREISSYKGGAPLLFPGEERARSGKKKKKKSAIYVQGGEVERVIGDKNARLKEVDFFAVARGRSRKATGCPYFDPNSKSKFSVLREVVDQNVTLYDRRAGKTLQSRTFKASVPKCPKSLDPSKRTLKGSVDARDVDTWLEQTLSRQ